MLGNERIEALLEVEFQPTGVFGKLFYNMGFKGKTYANQIAKKYKVNETIQENIANHGDLSKGQAKKQQRELEQVKVAPGQAKKQAQQSEPAEGESEKVAPGQAKKQAVQPESAEGETPTKGKSGKVPPGQAKK